MSDLKLQEKGFLLWIGMGILACMVLLTVISFIDFRNDSQHTQTAAFAAAACNGCGTQSIPQCMRCGSVMQWDSSAAMHRCPRCQTTSRVSCPACGMAMLNAQQTMPQQAAPQQAAWFHRPGCPMIVPQAAPQPVAWGTLPAAVPNYPLCPQCGRRIAQAGVR